MPSDAEKRLLWLLLLLVLVLLGRPGGRLLLLRRLLLLQLLRGRGAGSLARLRDAVRWRDGAAVGSRRTVFH